MASQGSTGRMVGTITSIPYWERKNRVSIRAREPSLTRDIRILGDDVTVALRSARQRFAAQGRLGGSSGNLGSFLLNPGCPDERKLPSTSSATPLAKGDVLRIMTPGGGGVGIPAERNHDATAHDLLEEKVSEGHASELKRRTGTVY
jgi:N-methylhydantoinase B/oxoprolinase/acetone carboxylase alpha subunit